VGGGRNQRGFLLVASIISKGTTHASVVKKKDGEKTSKAKQCGEKGPCCNQGHHLKELCVLRIRRERAALVGYMKMRGRVRRVKSQKKGLIMEGRTYRMVV